MRKIIVLFIAIIGHELPAQNTKVFAALGNLAQLPYQCFEVDGLLSSKDKQYQFLGAIHLTDGYTNGPQLRNKVEFNSGYMKKASDKLQGLGFGTQLRYKIGQRGVSGNTAVYFALGFNYYNYKLRFYENDYVQDQPPFYHYSVIVHKERFTRIAPDAQIIFNYSPNIFFLEFGIGVASYQSKIPDAIENYRTYHTSNIDYGFSGIGPAFSVRMGAWLF